jgi:YfiH family protein
MIPVGLQAPVLSTLNGIAHGFFTRQGGVSRGLYASLNCGFGSRDDAERVVENRSRVAAALDVPSDGLLTCHQVHSASAVAVETVWNRGSAPHADALVTDRPGVALGILTADCVPILFADPEARVIGAAHAGWKGARAGIAEAAVEAMVGLGANATRICAAVGPSIRQPSYEVGPDLAAQFAGAERFFQPVPSSDRLLFDLPGYVRERLVRIGLRSIEDLELDTRADPDRFFSFRRATLGGEADYGRQISAIALS